MQKSTETRDVAVPETRSAEGQIEIDATPERVWQALTDARELERWFPLDARVEPGTGGSIWMSWRNEFAASMQIQVWDPPHHLRTAWSFHEGEAGQVTDYWIEAKGGKSVVRAVTSGFPLDAAWDGWVEGTRRGWAFELRSLKHYLERHAGEARQVAYVRWRVPLSARDAWQRLDASTETAPWLCAGQAFDHRPSGQYAAVLSDPDDALFRLSIEPGAPGGPHEVVLWLSAWGGSDARTHEIQSEWARRLARLFPEGAAP
jgi:uncharacterized protein YndB with AHSA1/START domain